MSWRLHGRKVSHCADCQKPAALVVQGGLTVASEKQDIDAGKVVFVDCQASGLPEWICLACHPKWSDLNEIACKIFDWQMAKEDAIRARDFQLAAQYRDRQQSVRRLLAELVAQLGSDG